MLHYFDRFKRRSRLNKDPSEAPLKIIPAEDHRSMNESLKKSIRDTRFNNDKLLRRINKSRAILNLLSVHRESKLDLDPPDHSNTSSKDFDLSIMQNPELISILKDLKNTTSESQSLLQELCGQIRVLRRRIALFDDKNKIETIPDFVEELETSNYDELVLEYILGNQILTQKIEENLITAESFEHQSDKLESILWQNPSFDSPDQIVSDSSYLHTETRAQSTIDLAKLHLRNESLQIKYQHSNSRVLRAKARHDFIKYQVEHSLDFNS